MKFFQILHIGEEVINAILAVMAGQPGSTSVAFQGKHYQITVTPTP